MSTFTIIVVAFVVCTASAYPPWTKVENLQDPSFRRMVARAVERGRKTKLSGILSGMYKTIPDKRVYEVIVSVGNGNPCYSNFQTMNRRPKKPIKSFLTCDGAMVPKTHERKRRRRRRNSSDDSDVSDRVARRHKKGRKRRRRDSSGESYEYESSSSEE